jgi:predicted Zn-dependent protease
MQAHLNLAYALVSSGEIEEGRRETDWCLAREPNNFTMRWLLALCEREEGRPEQALEEVRRALELSPDELRARVLEGQLLLYLRRPEEAYRRLKPLLPRYGTSRWLLTPLAQAATATGRRDEAQEYHNRSSLQREKDDPRSAE